MKVNFAHLKPQQPSYRIFGYQYFPLELEVSAAVKGLATLDEVTPRGP